MNKNVVFTICAKNYLAQALTLRESTINHNPDIDFFLFLADEAEGVKLNGLIELDKSWIPEWQTMAFKYNVIEFNTSIKPFCIQKLFNDGYDKVMYLDPDIYVVKPLDVIWNMLEDKSIVLTPHYCDIVEHFNGAVPESTFNADGVFNLGFIALKNNDCGQKIAKWWMNRLSNQCYADRNSALFVDQKWMDFVPALFPNETVATDHMGLNVAIWNLHERTLIIGKNGEYIISRNRDRKIFPLIFFHFSGFDPFETKVINRRHPNYNVEIYPSFAPIIEEYRTLVYKNEYDKYSKMSYSFNNYNNGYPVLSLHRRMLRVYLEDHTASSISNPFEVNGSFYIMIKKTSLLVEKVQKTTAPSESQKIGGRKMEKRLRTLLKFMLKIFGPIHYMLFIRYAQKIGISEYHYYLFDNVNK
jgi:hypothetical protein